MSEIEVGDYVRINNDFRLIALGIGKVIRINQDTIYVRMNLDLPISLKTENITKHSKNIIDLIEIGDIVNNHYVKAVYLDGAVKYIKLDNAYSPENHFTGVRTYEDDIETILTKEQMEANQYVVKRNMETN